MKRIITLALIVVSFTCVRAQSPQKMSFQAVIRNNTNTLLSNQAVGLKMSILQGSAAGTVVYSESQTATTNANGLVSIQIGGGTVLSGDFATILWANGPYFIQTETDVNGGTNYTLTSTTQLLSVPYALYAQSSGSSIPGPQGPIGLTGLAGPAGANGADGATGPQGLQGLAGTNGNNGADGLSAYQIWLNAGNTGTQADFLTSLQGAQGIAGTNGTDGATGAQGPQGPIGLTGPAGPAGANGADGATGPQGLQGLAGTNGNNGADGLSAYQIWLNAGNTGTQADFLTSLQGAQGIAGTNGTDGATGAQGPQGIKGDTGLTGATGAQGIQGIQGDKGDVGPQGLTGAQGPQGIAGTNGTNGTNGLSAYQIWLNAGNTGTETQFLTSLQGTTGATGPAGTNGTDGTNGVDGKNTLVNTTIEPVGTNCTNGGTKIEVGLDANNNGVLDANEINSSLTKYVCNGSSSNSGFNALSGSKIGISNSTVWTCPSGVNQIKVELWGAGGGGWKGMYSPCGSTSCYGNGGSGGYNSYIVNVTPGDTYNITIGQGGSNVYNGNAPNGGSTSFNNSIYAEGGQGAVPYGNGSNAPVNNWNYSNSSSPSYIPTNYFSIPGLAHGAIYIITYYDTGPSGNFNGAESGFCIITIL